jgi:hypothetical protein
MLRERVAVALLRASPKIQHRPVQPLRCGVDQTQPTVSDDLPSAAAGKQLVPQSPRRSDPAGDRAPALTRSRRASRRDDRIRVPRRERPRSQTQPERATWTCYWRTGGARRRARRGSLFFHTGIPIVGRGCCPEGAISESGRLPADVARCPERAAPRAQSIGMGTAGRLRIVASDSEMIRPVVATDLVKAVGDRAACELRAWCFDVVAPRRFGSLVRRQPVLCFEHVEKAGGLLVVGAQLRNCDPEEWPLAERR